MVVGDLNCLRQRTGDVRPHDLAEQALVGMVMQIEKTRQDKDSRGVDFLLPFGWKFRSDGGNLLAFDGDIDRLLLAPHPSVANNDTHKTDQTPITARRFTGWASYAFENMQTARAVDQVDQATVVEAHVIALDARSAGRHVWHE